MIQEFHVVLLAIKLELAFQIKPRARTETAMYFGMELITPMQ